ncbi:hypothetical protein MC64_005155 [Aeromonas caviae]|nr:hypothetical protein A6763_01515 [Aeromonas caviae]PNO54923.1 hypothetical protein MC64_005155 [Aeromonas caviae]TNH74264.1 hypothetical protein CF142_07680 [Aeromonas caviae]BBS15140.1 hypothetical protein WP5W18E02_01770 [Aeromonas caviae]
MIAAFMHRAGWQHPALFLLAPSRAHPIPPPRSVLGTGLKSRFAIPIFSSMHSQAVIRLKRGK